MNPEKFNDEDLVLIHRIKGGDKSAFNLLMNKYQKTVLNIIYRFTGNPRISQDLAQEVFLRVYKGLNSFQGKSRFFTWLYKITMNLCLRYRQREKKFFWQSWEEKSGEGFDIPQPSAEEDLDRKELQNLVRTAVLSLPEDQRSVVILSRFQDLSYEEIAQVLDISMPAVKSRLHRARENLKKKLEPGR